MDNFKIDTQNMENNMATNREPTDVNWFYGFAGFTGLLFIITIVCLCRGNMQAVMGGLDSDGRICGFHDAVKDYPVVYWTLTLHKDDFDNDRQIAMFNSAICLKVCPVKAGQKVDCVKTANIQSCDSITKQVYPTTNVAQRCFPPNTNDVPEAYRDAVDGMLGEVNRGGMSSEIY